MVRQEPPVFVLYAIPDMSGQAKRSGYEEGRQRESGRGHHQERAARKLLSVFTQHRIEVFDLG